MKSYPQRTQNILFSLILPLLILALLPGCREDDEVEMSHPYRVGVNFVTVSRAESAGLDGTAGMLEDLSALGVGGIRQLPGADVCWHSIYDGSGDYDDPNNYDFSASDELIANDSEIYIIPTLFQIGATSAVLHGAPDDQSLYTPDGDKIDVSDSRIADQVEGYVRVVAARYKYWVKHFEVANEIKGMSDFSAEDYARLLICVKSALEDVDPDLQLVLGGLAGTVDGVFYNHLDWFEEVLEELEDRGRLDVIDVVNFHYYDRWELLPCAIDALKDLLEDFGIEDRPIWATEIGSSYIASDQSGHTEDASESEQASDLFRKLSICFGSGVDLVGWHTYISGTDTISESNTWYGFGLRHPGGRKALSYYSFALFSDVLGDFKSCQALSEGEDGVWAYRFLVQQSRGGVMFTSKWVWVLWSEEESGTSYVISAGGSTSVQVTSVVSDAEGNFTSESQDPSAISLSRTPVLIEYSPHLKLGSSLVGTGRTAEKSVGLEKKVMISDGRLGR